MGLEDNSNSIEQLLDGLVKELNLACDLAKEFGGETPLENLPHFDALVGHQDEIVTTMASLFGVDLNNPQVVKEYVPKGTEGSPGEGEIIIKVIATSDPEVFLGKYTYPNGDVTWTIRPLDGVL